MSTDIILGEGEVTEQQATCMTGYFKQVTSTIKKQHYPPSSHYFIHLPKLIGCWILIMKQIYILITIIIKCNNLQALVNSSSWIQVFNSQLEDDVSKKRSPHLQYSILIVMNVVKEKTNLLHIFETALAVQLKLLGTLKIKLSTWLLLFGVLMKQKALSQLDNQTIKT